MLRPSKFTQRLLLPLRRLGLTLARRLLSLLHPLLLGCVFLLQLLGLLLVPLLQLLRSGLRIFLLRHALVILFLPLLQLLSFPVLLSA